MSMLREVERPVTWELKWFAASDLNSGIQVNKHGDADMARLYHVISELGIIVPVIYNLNNRTIIDGHARVEAALIDDDMVPVLMVDLDAEQDALLRLALTSKYGRRDNEVITAVLKALDNKGVDLDNTGLKPAEVERLMNPPEPKRKEGKHVACPHCGNQVPV